MIIKAIKSDEQRQKLKEFHYVTIAFPDEDAMELFLAIADKNQLAILSYGNLKRVFNRIRGLLWDNVVARRAYANKTNESRREYQRNWYRANKKRINEEIRMKRKGFTPEKGITLV